MICIKYINRYLTLLLLACCPAVSAQNLEVCLLYSPEDASLAGASLCAVPGHGLYAAKGNVIYSLKDTIEIEVELSEKGDITDLFYQDGKFVFKFKNAVCMYKDGVQPVLAFETESFRIFQRSGDDVYLVMENGGQWGLFCISLVEKSITPLLKLGKEIVGVNERKALEQVWVATKDNIYSYGKENLVVFNSVEGINSVVYFGSSIYIGSGKGIFRLVDDMTCQHLFSCGVEQFLHDGKSMYVLTSEGGLFSIKETE